MKPKCPSCARTGGALEANLHCKAVDCTWNKCLCGVIYSRRTGGGFRESTRSLPAAHYPAVA